MEAKEDWKRFTLTYTVYNDDGDEEEITISARAEVCARCDGTGKHDHEAFSNGISGEAFEDDPDFADDYLSGVYDVTCTECHGRNVVLVPIESAANWPLVQKHLEQEAQFRREEAYERRMGY